ncbi:MAG: amidohydrolase family protein [Acidobacteriaceae bacterium]
MSASPIEAALAECAHWDILDANVYVGHSGISGALALEAPELLLEMDRFGIKRALVSHFVSHEYDAVEGNRALDRDANPRFVPAWSSSPDPSSLTDLERRNPRAVRLWFGVLHHNFSSAAWCASELFEYLQANRVLTVISRPEIEWDAVAVLLENFPRLNVLLLDVGYRSDRDLFPLLKKFPNVYFDSSTYFAHRQLEWYLEQFGPDRMVFGSRLPLYTPAAALMVLGTARVPDAARLAVAGGNLRRLIGESA